MAHRIRYWPSIPPFHGYVFGDRVFYGEWGIDQLGRLHVQTAHFEMWGQMEGSGSCGAGTPERRYRDRKTPFAISLRQFPRAASAARTQDSRDTVRSSGPTATNTLPGASLNL